MTFDDALYFAVLMAAGLGVLALLGLVADWLDGRERRDARRRNR